MINDTFHQIELGPKWRWFLSVTRERVRRKGYITKENWQKGREAAKRNREAA